MFFGQLPKDVRILFTSPQLKFAGRIYYRPANFDTVFVRGKLDPSSINWMPVSPTLFSVRDQVIRAHDCEFDHITLPGPPLVPAEVFKQKPNDPLRVGHLVIVPKQIDGQV